jgi:hypothetical protein
MNGRNYVSSIEARLKFNCHNLFIVRGDGDMAGRRIGAALRARLIRWAVDERVLGHRAAAAPAARNTAF